MANAPPPDDVAERDDRRAKTTPQYNHISETVSYIDALLSFKTGARQIWVDQRHRLIATISEIAGGIRELFPRVRELWGSGDDDDPDFRAAWLRPARSDETGVEFLIKLYQGS
ncbi:hypothetical protein CYMTET_37391 [Cymbomonas tetramitiformis]|uniref:Uncharacterized protein n=1 Tax=Cymbomonas tetramitiformis TaxID=36881 RepID=A0AAE0CGG6_9CHLO|nr:hypothetical protein CYMTET_37391 [Cymbomonas tetramitiformis]